MVRTELRAASEDLRAASDAESDGSLAAELADLADHMEHLATRDRGPDHGRMARHDRAMLHLIDDTEGDVRDRVESALDRLRSYRSTVEGV
jgi:hypothetical protein